jgi:hypothetical protein
MMPAPARITGLTRMLGDLVGCLDNRPGFVASLDECLLIVGFGCG